MPASFPLTEEQIRQALAQPVLLPRTVDVRASFFEQKARSAAVLIPLAWIEQGAEPGWHIIFTRRTDAVPDHKGQVAFPGGRAEPQDAYPSDTALREASEEIGLAPQDVRILGQMDGLLTISNYHITPVIGIIPWPYTFQMQPSEVSRVFSIPLSWLANPAHHEIRHREIHFPSQPEPVSLRVIYFKPYDQEILWGISAEITLRLLHILALLK